MISMYLGVVHSGENDVRGVTLSLYIHIKQAEKYVWPGRESNLRPLECHVAQSTTN